MAPISTPPPAMQTLQQKNRQAEQLAPARSEAFKEAMCMRVITAVPAFGALETEGATEGEMAARHPILRNLSRQSPMRMAGMWVSAHACKTASFKLCKEAT